MLIDYATLKEALPPETLENLIREYLLGQVGDEGFDELTPERLADSAARAHHALRLGELVVEFSEQEESVAIRRADEVAAALEN
ncbi:YheU family protein [Ferrimonas gelatinilytica]